MTESPRTRLIPPVALTESPRPVTPLTASAQQHRPLRLLGGYSLPLRIWGIDDYLVVVPSVHSGGFTALSSQRPYLFGSDLSCQFEQYHPSNCFHEDTPLWFSTRLITPNSTRYMPQDLGHIFQGQGCYTNHGCDDGVIGLTEFITMSGRNSRG